jgi:hypothetical protein
MFSWIFGKRKKGLRTTIGFEEKQKAIDNKHELARNIMEKLSGDVDIQRERRHNVIPDFIPNRRGA